MTDREGSAVTLDADYRRHAVCKLAIRDLKYGAGPTPLPLPVLLANAAWLVIATLAHNLLRWPPASSPRPRSAGRQDPAAPPSADPPGR